MDSNLADGQWHWVYVEKELQRVSLYVDGDEKTERGGKIAKVLKVDAPLFVGGVPDTFLPLLHEQVVSLTHFTGIL